MALKTFVIINNVNNLSDARYCAGMGVDVIGFNVNPTSPDYVDPEKFKVITNWLAGVKFSVDVEELSFEELDSIIETYKIEYVQTSNASILKDISRSGSLAIYKINLDRITSFENLERICFDHKDDVSYFLFESGKEMNDSLISFIKKLSLEYSVIVGVSISAEEVTELIETTAIKGICLKGGNEIKPGFKDYDELADILEAIETE